MGHEFSPLQLIGHRWRSISAAGSGSVVSNKWRDQFTRMWYIQLQSGFQFGPIWWTRLSVVFQLLFLQQKTETHCFLHMQSNQVSCGWGQGVCVRCAYNSQIRLFQLSSNERIRFVRYWHWTCHGRWRHDLNSGNDSLSYPSPSIRSLIDFQFADLVSGQKMDADVSWHFRCCSGPVCLDAFIRFHLYIFTYYTHTFISILFLHIIDFFLLVLKIH